MSSRTSSLFRLFPHALVCALLVGSALGGTLRDDSARVAQIWGLLQAGDTLAADSFADDTTLPASPLWPDLANFLAAYRAFADSNFAIVPAILDLGVPAELDEHAAWLRGSALRALGQSHLAGIYWRKLVGSPLPEYRELALGELFNDARASGKLDTLRSLAAAARFADASRSLRQRIDLDMAGFLTRSSNHSEATALLREAYLTSPGTTEGKAAKRLLDAYALTHGYAIPDPGWTGHWNEVERLERVGLNADALDKLLALRAKGRYAAHDEQMMARQARLSVTLRRHEDGLKFAQQHLKQFPQSSYRDEMRFCVVRSAYLTDQDTLAMNMAEELGRTGTDAERIGESWRLIALLHIDRDRPAAAAQAADQWYRAIANAGGADDALWMRAWTRYLAGEYARAAADFEQLVRNYPKSGYVPVGIYWAARSHEQAGTHARRDSLCSELLTRYPYSYYALLSCGLTPQPEPKALEMRVLNVDELLVVGGARTRAFAELTALGLWEFALREWPQVEAECGKRADVSFWRPLLYWKNGERFEAWKWTIKELRDEAASAGERPAEFYELFYPLDYEPAAVGAMPGPVLIPILRSG
ncbi:MAG: tetratricopeptide repeat protein [bacterium]|nr:tetratricopeptide repeat protein [bacterium]